MNLVGDLFLMKLKRNRPTLCDLILFNEYFNGDNGAGLVIKPAGQV